MKIATGLSAGIFWALDTVILGIALSMLPFSGDGQAILLSPFIGAFLHDFCSSVWMLFYTGIKRQSRTVFRALGTRGGKVIMLGALFGGPIGMTGYVFAIRFLCFAAGGIFVGIASVLQVSYGGAIAPKAGMNTMSMVFPPFMGVFIGQYLERYCDIMLGIFLGVFSMTMINSGLIAMGLPGTLQQVVTGSFMLIFMAISINREQLVLKKKKAEAL